MQLRIKKLLLAYFPDHPVCVKRQDDDEWYYGRNTTPAAKNRPTAAVYASDATTGNVNQAASFDGDVQPTWKTTRF